MTEGPAKVQSFWDAYAVVIGGYRMTEYTSEESIAQDQADRINRALAPLVEKANTAEKEALEQARLNGMGAEREAALRGEIERVKKAAEKMAEALLEIRNKGDWQSKVVPAGFPEGYKRAALECRDIALKALAVWEKTRGATRPGATSGPEGEK